MSRVFIKDYLRGPWRIGSEFHEGPVPPASKLLPGDPKAAPLHGVIDFLNRTGQGFTGRGVPLYLFHPLDPAWPPMLISSKERPAENMLATVAYEHWNDKWPRAGIRKIHGPVGNVEKESQLLKEAYDPPSTVMDLLSIPVCPELPTLAEWSHCFNVDPAGCLDCDDIFAWRSCADGDEFMIAIADVSAFVAPGSPHDMAARANAFTIYDNDGFAWRPMFPKSFSEGTASLLNDGVWRPVVGLVFTICDGDVIRREWLSTSVRLTAAHTYESVVGSAEYEPLYNYLSLVCDGRISPTDTHDWVAQAMITYNTAAAGVLKDAGLGLLRRHTGTELGRYELAASVTGCDALRSLGAAAGEYCVGSAIQTSHSGLGLAAYCHASSPLRRYADLVNQRWLKYLMFGAAAPPLEPVESLADILNTRGRQIKNLERDLWFLRFIRPHAITTTTGYALECVDPVVGAWKVYAPEWRRVLRGVSTEGAVLAPGSKVVLRVYCDLRRPRWRDQLVCSIGLTAAELDL